MQDNRPHADNCGWALGNQSCECGYYVRQREQAKADALVDGLLADARTKEFAKLHTASDLADARTEVSTLRLRVEVLESYINDARRAGYEAAREQAAKMLDAEATRCGPVLNGAGQWRIFAKRIRAMRPDGETTT